MKNILNDLSVITKLSIATIKRFKKNVLALLCHYVAESSIEQLSETQIDMGIGVLTIKVDGKEVTSSFIFDDKAKKSLISASSKNSSMLEDMIDDAISDKVHEKFKELL